MSLDRSSSASGSGEKKTIRNAKPLAQAEPNQYIGELREIRNKVRGKMENADLSNPEEVALLKATARMWNIRLPHAF
jgi:hypothetical protein